MSPSDEHPVAPNPDVDRYTESPNSTANDWVGPSVQRDADLVDRLVVETKGGLREAERNYAQQRNQGENTNQIANRPDGATDRGANDTPRKPAAPVSTKAAAAVGRGATGHDREAEGTAVEREQHVDAVCHVIEFESGLD